MVNFYAPIRKVDASQRLVTGYASTEAVDSQGEIILRSALADALGDYMRFANIREMHQPSAVGVTKSAEVDEKGLWITAKIVDRNAWDKVTEGVYRGFSIGGKVTSRDDRQQNVVTGLDLMEISLVDRPACPDAVIELYKRAGAGPLAAIIASPAISPALRGRLVKVSAIVDGGSPAEIERNRGLIDAVVGELNALAATVTEHTAMRQAFGSPRSYTADAGAR